MPQLMWPPPPDAVEVIVFDGQDRDTAPAADAALAPASAAQPTRNEGRMSWPRAGARPPVPRARPTESDARGTQGRRQPGGRRLKPEGIIVVLLAAIALAEAWVLVRGQAASTDGAVAKEAANATLPTPGLVETAPNVVAPPELSVRTEPPGAQVSVDGQPWGVSPVTLRDLAAGEHTVAVHSRGARIEQQVTLVPGQSVSLVVPFATVARAPETGTLVVRSPVEVRIFQEGRLLGTSQMMGVELASGSSSVEFVNESIGYHETRTVKAEPGKVTSIALEIPPGALALNAVPWADVWVDGVPAGATPIGRLGVAAGPHTIVFRHPRLGERTISTVIRVGESQRLSVDLTR